MKKPSHTVTRTLSTHELTKVSGAGLFSDVISTLDRWLSPSVPETGKNTGTGGSAERQAASTAGTATPPK